MAKWQLLCYPRQRVCMDWVDRPQNYKDWYGILQLLQDSHSDNFSLKTLKLGWVAFQSLHFQLKCLDFQSNQYKKLAPVLSRFCNGLCPLRVNAAIPANTDAVRCLRRGFYCNADTRRDRSRKGTCQCLTTVASQSEYTSLVCTCGRKQFSTQDDRKRQLLSSMWND